MAPNFPDGLMLLLKTKDSYIIQVRNFSSS
jgi:hypothetical protein